MVNGIDGQLSRLRYCVRRRFRRARVGSCRRVPENYVLPGKRVAAQVAPTIRLRNWYRARKAAAFARNTRSSDFFSAEKRENGALERRAIQRWKPYAIRAQIGTYCEPSERGYLTRFLSEELPEERSIFICVCIAVCWIIHTSFQLTSAKREIILIGYLYDNLICIFGRRCDILINAG